MLDKADLEFLPGYQPEGFNSKIIASYDETNPAIIVRELIQNSMDASNIADREQCQVKFRIETVARGDIPGIASYKRAFGSAKETHASNIENAQAIVERIEGQLEKEELSVLNVIDNGIGLNTERMNRLLGDGFSSKTGKDRSASGSYGVGHYSVYPCSDLQYILYGGVSSEGRTLSGHAILASHTLAEIDQTHSSKTAGTSESGHFCGKDGFYISGRNRSHDNPFAFDTGDDLTHSLTGILDEIESESTTGSVVSVLGYNHFRKSELEEGSVDSKSTILSVIASSFFMPIIEGKLKISIYEEDKVITLAKEDINSILLKEAHNKRRTTRAIQNGQDTFTSFRTYISPTRECEIDTSYGRIHAYYREAEHGEATKISLYRNGMFITSTIPNVKAHQFNAYKRFNLVLRVDSGSENEPSVAFQLIRSAEGESHLDLNSKRLTNDQRKQFREMTRSIREQVIQELCTRDEADSFNPGVFNFDFGNGTSALGSTERAGRTGNRTNEIEELDEIDPDNGNGAGNSGRSGGGGG